MPSDQLPELDVAQATGLAAELASELAAKGGRALLGIAGPPGAGKSSLSESLRRALPAGSFTAVPMDGFHLAQAELERLGRADRKGAPDTFDASGFVALLRRLAAQQTKDAPIYAPAFRRELEEPIAGAIEVLGSTPLIVVEGNYLLLDEEPWAQVRPLLRQCWYLTVPGDLRVRQLINRHVKHGRSREEAVEWVMRSDEANARVVEASRHRADAFIRR